MNSLAAISLSGICLSAAVGALVGAGAVLATSTDTVTPPEPRPVAAGDPTDPRVDALVARLDDLDQRLRAGLEAAPVRTSVADDAVPRDELEATVRRLVAAARAEPIATAAVDIAKGPLPAADDVVAALVEHGSFSDAGGDLWERANAEDRLQEVLDAFVAWAEARPGSPDAQVELARAYRAAGMQRPNHPDGTWWIEADASYDRALELEPTNWDARFEKAVSLSHWPDMWGRRPEAIEHLEHLVEQQQSMPLEPRQADVYLYLGNLLSQSGQEERAQETWRRGLERFPAHDALAGRVGGGR